ncbi:MAG: porin [Thermoanaerobaculia bacterium]
MRTRFRTATGGLLVAACLGGLAAPAGAQLQWTSKDEKMNFKIGLLAQMQGESADVAGSDDTANNLFFRRLRLLMSFSLGEKLSIFLETDSPNLGKSNNAGVKDANDVYIQDFVATYKFSKQFMLDAGMLLLEQSYNHNQSAASLLTTDYGPYSFVESGPTGERVGRDYGLRARGYLLGDHLEYRAGVYQGVRGTNASNDLRYGGRLMYSFFTPQVGLFYRGTSLGKTQTLSIGTSYETQEEYDSVGIDFFWDQPIAGNSFVVQGDLVNVDGGTFLTNLPDQTNLLLEAGFYIAPIKLQPFVQYAKQDFDDASRTDEDRLTAGLAFFFGGHNNNLKFSYTRIEPDGGNSRDQINLQWQIFQF